MGYDLEMAREFIDVCAMWARAFGIAAEEVGEEILDHDGEKFQAFRIRFSSGFKVVALPSVPRALRGKQRSEEHTSELQSLMRISSAVFCFKQKNTTRDT